MPSTAHKKGTRRTPSARDSRKPPATQSLLVLHLDAPRLRADGLHLGQAAMVATIPALGMGSNAVIEDASTNADLMATLARHAEAKRTFDVVVAVGHSNANGIRVATDLFMPWEGFARLLRPFQPRRLLLVACQAGRADAGEALFCGLPALRRIYACPVNASRDFGTAMMVAIPYVVASRRPKDKHVTLAQAASVALTGRQLREWRRTTDKGNPNGVLHDLIADVTDPLAREMPRFLGSLFSR